MPKIPYVPVDIREPADIVTAVRARRGGDLLHLDRMLLHSPPFALGWNSLLGAVRSGLALPPRLRELAICAVGALNGAEYEIQQHAGPFREAGGTDQQFEALRDCDRAARDATLFSRAEQAVLDLTMAMTRHVQVSPELMAATRATLRNDQELVELVGVIAAYNMVSRFLIALGIEPEEHTSWMR
jgi:alkylhydroperoxidase family enzyme